MRIPRKTLNETVIVKLQACNLYFTEKVAPSICFTYKFATPSEQTSQAFEQLHGKFFVHIAEAQPGPSQTSKKESFVITVNG